MAGEGKIPAVKIEFEKNDKVIIRTPCQGLIKKIKMISGRRWNPKGKWEVPYSEDSIAKLQFLRILSLILIFILSHYRWNFS